ncbi:uncharacterized protein GVI51_C05225 [Nakaseomyces glabratus]|uniref:Dolichyl-diphosphooligosaccharide--protein glycosyltransferase subunit 4 n=1 Tax=Candida glabrata (strain ATCC 2001 / BCRC 20586 / JCM 3761 / NBRC 0622 / NRRL Y-65 / CBS 138) TaxID=284593 RepID=B4UMY5_CANGA|nr:uncharacterized protein CAGL0C05461g [Nakaseomyces glabratus]KAH7590268.1 Oligosaccaryltransferase [Nakaseomyces glabratus]KAH7591292.1 Oligosaccaryltransferase [Nakaseomyces glabratus]KAH7597547.1 Oligosaccaryltransferase [Nakaseomyces glabratus]KAH7607968.1 Oligosaccaryltransferase [Nakaseomyces glabratus]KAH7608751.1 Oligosaccaryltransferase [Nakaseomyces glabratus]|eukprot:XP_002999526.1 uncharacterized protein CAGL0C05461g [[Candida] glabrata]
MINEGQLQTLVIGFGLAMVVLVVVYHAVASTMAVKRD